MRGITFGRRELYLCSSSELANAADRDCSFAIMWSSDAAMPRDSLMAIVGAFLSPKCAEVFLVGKSAEVLHDLVDEVIEDMALFQIATSTPSGEETVDDICGYFLTAAGGGPPVLIAAVAESPQLEQRLQEMALAFPPMSG